ncbi:MAG: hypothetical protein WB986_05750 [Methanoregula sp.]|uniref:hypothetical protein n=1 Tax=Methanoregula sp. TaxID=2052170 RepID=UPI003BAEFB27
MKAVIGRTGETPAALVFPECGDPRLNVPPALLPGGCGGGYPYILPRRGCGRDKQNTKTGFFVVPGDLIRTQPAPHGW